MEYVQHPDEDAEFNEEERPFAADISSESIERNPICLRDKTIRFLRPCSCRCACSRTLFYKWQHYTPEEELMKRHGKIVCFMLVAWSYNLAIKLVIGK